MVTNGDELRVKIPGFVIAARDWGPRDGTPVIAIHGWLDNASSFEFLAPKIPTARIVAIDTPGCGHSSFRSAGSLPSILDEIFYVLQVANELGFEKFTLLGHSRGGALAQLVASGAPERINSLILLDTVGFYVSQPEDSVTHLRNAIKTFFGPQRPASAFVDLKSAAEGRMLASDIAYESALALAKRGTDIVDGIRRWTFDRREMNLTMVLRYSDEQLRQILTGIEAPTCIIMADDGILKDKKAIKERASLIKNHELHIVPGHHHVHMDDADVVAKYINPFLKKWTK
jgi:pimeloyl-ACP methyl ester carboxylesterase